MPERPRILLVDDERRHTQGMEIRLRASGYDVLTAYDGAAGLHLAAAERPDAIVMDVQMPVMDGMTALAQLAARPETRHIPVIMVSACMERRQAALEQGASYFLGKPYDGKTLLSAIETLTASSTKSPLPLREGEG